MEIAVVAQLVAERNEKSTNDLERAMGIQPTSEAWEAKAYLTKTLERRHFSSLSQALKRKITENSETTAYAFHSDSTLVR